MARVLTKEEEILAGKQVRLLGPDGAEAGIVKFEAAFAKSEEVGLDLVEIAPKAKPPVVKLMDFKKFLYEKKKQEKEAKKKQVVQKTKEVKFHVNIDKHDYEFKLKNALKFLGQGNKLKITIQYRGREMAHKDLGEALMKKIIEFLQEEATVEMRPKLQGRNYTMIMAPLATRKS